MRIGGLVGLSVLALMLAPPVSAQEVGGDAGSTLTIFFDCQTFGCRDLDYFRREVPFVNWARNREDAQVHVLVTSQGTGGGGRLYTLAFIGLADLEGTDEELTTATAGDATEDDRRGAVAQRLRIGLVPYLADLPVAERLSIAVEGDSTGGPGGVPDAPTGDEDDPWDFWTFRVGANGFLNGESSARFSDYFLTASANRTTEAWKLIFSANRSESIQEFFDIPNGDGTTRDVKETRIDWGADGSVVRSLGDRWAVGLRANAGSSSYLNQDLRLSLRPGVEFNFFPYSESSRRSLTLQYLVGPFHWDYTERTIFLETAETRWQESLTASLSLVQPWGRWTTSLEGAHYLHDAGKYNVTLSGNFNVRLFRGFSVRMFGRYSWIRDQLYIPGEGASSDEILLRQQQLETSFRYFTSFGIEYRFGSILNNVVNPRFGGGEGEFFFF